MDAVRSYLYLLFVFSVCLVHQPKAEPGFLNIACGALEGTTFIDNSTTLKYTSDVNFVDTGVPKSLDSSLKKTPDPKYLNKRTFPDGLRNCYRFKLFKGKQYFITARFKFEPSLDRETPSFDLYLGNYRCWEIFYSPRFQDEIAFWEVLHLQSSDHLHICLVKTGPSIPFISVLEVREADNAPYTANIAPLKHRSRQDIGSTSGREIRFKDDPFDRRWDPYNPSKWQQIWTTKDIDTSNNFRLPSFVMRSAATPSNPEEPMTLLNLSLAYQLHQLDVYLHVAELQELRSDQFREFEVFCNGKRLYGPFSPIYLKATTLYVKTPVPKLNDNRRFIIYLAKTGRSTLPPLLNGFEVYENIITQQGEGIESEGGISWTNGIAFSRFFSKKSWMIFSVDAMFDIKKTYDLKEVTWQGDPCAPPNFTWKGVECRENGLTLWITSLNLTGRGLTGSITQKISSLNYLETLDMSNNYLSGEIPSFLADMRALKVLNLVGNKFDNSVPQSLLDKANKGMISLCIDGREEACSTTFRKRNNNGVLGLTILSSLTLVLVPGGVMLVYLFWSWHPFGPFCFSAHHDEWTPTVRNSKKFRYSEILIITNNLEKLVGKGGFGEVYQGILEGTEVAVKILNKSIHGYDQLKNEVELLMAIHHRSLITLIGYCVEKEKLALVYEFMTNGNLQEHLSGIHGKTNLDWRTRLQIALHTAQGLDYLHNTCVPQIIHRDVKSSNILLDKDFNAKLSDFGLSKAFSIEGQTHISTIPAGTPGYFDPECYKTFKLTEKSDVYSFGVTLLELVANRPVVGQSEENPHIKDWVEAMITRGVIHEILDPQLQKNVETNLVEKVIKLAMSCTTMPGFNRPIMGDVVTILKECLATQIAREREENEDVYTGQLQSVNVMSESSFGPR